jgi:hypothetical protein
MNPLEACLYVALLLRRSLGLSGVVVQIDFGSQSHNFTISIVAARRANVVWALQLTAVAALVRVRSHQRVMGAAIVAARLGYFILLDGHVSTFGVKGPLWAHVSMLASGDGVVWASNASREARPEP